MTLTEGTKLGRYEIRSLIGVGGMGEVYRAFDPKIGREVAIKVLPADFSADKERVARFEQEAQAAGALNHPNIIAVYDVDTQDDILYVVSELLEGEELRQRLDEGPIPLRKVTEYAQQIVSGLTAAHEKGFTHRDLKPENLFITKDDRVKILDFGLAKLREPDTNIHGSEDATRRALTNPGVVMGTVGYMSPEQVRGHATDQRSDIFSFGVILYEMLTGNRAFSGDSVVELMNAILKEDVPEIEETGAKVPPALDKLMRRCLEKKPEHRFHSAHDLGFALEAFSSPTRSSGSGLMTAANTAVSVAEKSGWQSRLPWIATGVLALAVVALGLSRMLTPSPPPPPFVTLDVTAPPGWNTNLTSALSPDGTRLAFTASHPQEKIYLWVRFLATGESQMIAETEDAIEPFWSPDSTEIGFFTRDRLRAVNLANGRSRVICDVIGARRGGTWNSSGVIVFSTESGVPFKKVNADGKSAPAELPHGGFRPFFLPDGRHFLYGDRGNNIGVSIGLFLGDIETGEVKELRPDGAEPKYADGYVFFVLDRQLHAQRFDAATFKLSGESTPIAEIGEHNGSAGKNYSVAANGLIAFRTRAGEAPGEITWYTRDGTRNIIGEPGNYANPAFSPDDSMIAMARGDGTASDIWLFDAARGNGKMFASGRPAGAICPIWSGDGRSIFYKKQSGGFFEKAVEGGSERTIIASNAAGNGQDFTFPFLTQITTDGRVIGFRLNNGNRDIVIRTASGEETYFARSPANETQPALSPDERWLAYVYSEEESPDTKVVFVDAFPGGGQRLRVSGDLAGVQPRWRRDGRELYYVDRDKNLMAVSVETTGRTLKLGTPKPLFKTNINPSSGLGTRASYDAVRDGSRFIVTEPKTHDGAESQPITVLVNWQSVLKK